MEPLTQGAGLHIYFKLQVFFHTLTKALGQRFNIFSFPHPDLLSPEITVVLQSSCFSDSLRIGFTIYHLFLIDTISVLYLTCDYIVTHATFLSLFLIFLNLFAPSILRSLSPKKASSYS